MRRRGRPGALPGLESIAARPGKMSDVRSGDEELSRRAADLAARLPEALAPLARIAYNYRWAWYPRGKEVFRAIDPHRWQICGENPVRLLQEVSSEALARAAGDSDLIARATELEDAFATDLGRPSVGPISPEHPVAFLCAEYGVHHSLPVYSGGLGALAGDLVKEASDQALPLVAVGLLYRQGYFRQRLDASGWQQEYWIDNDPERLPMALVHGPDGEPLTITVSIRGSDVRAQVCASRSAACRCFCLMPIDPRTAPWSGGSPHSCTSVTRLPACRSTRCSASAVFGRWRRWGSSRRWCT
jgi:starch phosphorylase